MGVGEPSGASDPPLGLQFLVQLKIMGYSLLLGIHDIIRGSEPEADAPAREEEPEADGACGPAAPPAPLGSCGASAEGVGGCLHPHRPLGPGEFESFVDVYAIRSAEGESAPGDGGRGSWGTGPSVVLGGCLASRRWWGGSGRDRDRTRPPPLASPPGAPQQEVYFMGLIDILTQYDAKKKAAHAAKTVKHGVRAGRSLLPAARAPPASRRAVRWQGVEGWVWSRSGGRERGRAAGADTLFRTFLSQAGAEISTVHPEQYAKRFLDFITNIFA